MCDAPTAANRAVTSAASALDFFFFFFFFTSFVAVVADNMEWVRVRLKVNRVMFVVV